MKRFEVLLIILLLLFNFSYGYCQVTNGKEAPVFNLRNINGQLVKPFSEPRLIIISFFFTDCQNCKKEIRKLEELNQKYNDKVTIYLIGTSFKNDVDVTDDVDAFIKALNVSFIPLVDKYKEVIASYGITVYPSVYLINKKRKVIYASSSYNEATAEELEKHIKKAK